MSKFTVFCGLFVYVASPYKLINLSLSTKQITNSNVIMNSECVYVVSDVSNSVINGHNKKRG